MYEDNAVAVVVPAYNEEGFVGDVIDTMPSIVDCVYVVDDCSSDDTWGEINRVARRVGGTASTDEPADGASEPSPESERRPVIGDEIDSAVADGGTSGQETSPSQAEIVAGSGDITRVSPPDPSTDGGTSGRPAVVPIRHDENRGVGAAIKTGYQESLEDEMDITAVMAGDGQMDPDQLERLLEPVAEGHTAYAKGNRLAGSEHIDAMSNWRLFGNLTLTFLTKVASGYWEMMDPQNGYTAISREALEAIDLEGLYDRYGFTNDLLVALNTHDFRIADVSMPAVYGDEESHIRYRSFVPSLSWLLLQGFLYRLNHKYVLRKFHPLSLLYALGAVGWTLALCTLSWAGRTRSNTDSSAVRVLSSILFLFLGSICLVLAMTFDCDANEGTVVTVR